MYITTVIFFQYPFQWCFRNRYIDDCEYSLTAESPVVAMEKELRVQQLNEIDMNAKNL